MRAEFTVEPFVDASPGPHVTAAIQAAADAIEDLARSISETVAADQLAPVDDLLPQESDFHGEAMTP